MYYIVISIFLFFVSQLNILDMTAREYNRDFWCIVVTPLLGRRPVSLPVLASLLGSKIYQVFRKLEQNKYDKLVVRPFHGETYIFYRH